MNGSPVGPQTAQGASLATKENRTGSKSGRSGTRRSRAGCRGIAEPPRDTEDTRKTDAAVQVQGQSLPSRNFPFFSNLNQQVPRQVGGLYLPAGPFPEPRTQVTSVLGAPQKHEDEPVPKPEPLVPARAGRAPCSPHSVFPLPWLLWPRPLEARRPHLALPSLPSGVFHASCPRAVCLGTQEHPA